MRVLPESPRRRKRAIVLALLAAAAVLAAIIGLTLSNTSHEKETFERGKAQVIHDQVPAPSLRPTGAPSSGPSTASSRRRSPGATSRPPTT